MKVNQPIFGESYEYKLKVEEKKRVTLPYFSKHFTRINKVIKDSIKFVFPDNRSNKYSPADFTMLKLENLRLTHRLQALLSKVSKVDCEGVENINLGPYIKGNYFESELTGDFDPSQMKINDFSEEVKSQMVEIFKDDFSTDAVRNKKFKAVRLGANNGWPTCTPGNDPRNLLEMIIYMKLAEKMKTRRDVQQFLNHFTKVLNLYPFYTYAERESDSNKQKPLFSAQSATCQLFSSNLVFPRKRKVTINLRIMALANKPFISNVIKSLFSHQWLCVAPKYAGGIIRGAKKDFHRVSADFSTYDYSQKAPLGDNIRDLIARIFKFEGNEKWRDISSLHYKEIFELVPYLNDLIRIEGEKQLLSGLEHTTIQNCVFNAAMFTSFVKYLGSRINRELKFYYPNFDRSNPLEQIIPILRYVDIFALIHGDDLIMMIRKDIMTEEELRQHMDEYYNGQLGARLGFEPALKFLGWLYEPYDGYSLFRNIINRVTPERERPSELVRLGTCISYDFVADELKDHYLKEIYPVIYDELAIIGKLRRDKATNRFIRYKQDLPTPDEMRAKPERDRIIKEGIEYANTIGRDKTEVMDMFYSYIHRAMSAEDVPEHVFQFLGASGHDVQEVIDGSYESGGKTYSLEELERKAKDGSFIDAFTKIMNRKTTKARTKQHLKKLILLTRKIFLVGQYTDKDLLSFLEISARITFNK